MIRNSPSSNSLLKLDLWNLVDKGENAELTTDQQKYGSLGFYFWKISEDRFW